MNHPDLNLLIALDILLEEQSVVAAARRMNLSPPAMSRTLTRIRETVGDPILVRAGRGLVPTVRALELRDLVRTTAETAVGLLQLGSIDNLQDIERQFIIRANDVFVMSYGERLLKRLQSQAPKITLKFTVEHDLDDNALREGRIDLWIGASNALDPEVKVQHLFTTKFIGLAHKDHPIFNDEITPESFAKYDQVNVSRKGLSAGPIDIELNKLGLNRKVAIISPSFTMALFTLTGSHLIMPIPTYSLFGLEKLETKLKSFPLPLNLETFMIRQAWHPRLHNDAIHKWLRSCILEICQENH